MFCFCLFCLVLFLIQTWFGLERRLIGIKCVSLMNRETAARRKHRKNSETWCTNVRKYWRVVSLFSPYLFAAGFVYWKIQRWMWHWSYVFRSPASDLGTIANNKECIAIIYQTIRENDRHDGIFSYSETYFIKKLVSLVISDSFI